MVDNKLADEQKLARRESMSQMQAVLGASGRYPSSDTSPPIAFTVESGYHSASLKDQGVRIFYVKPEWYGLGISEAESPGSHIVT